MILYEIILDSKVLWRKLSMDDSLSNKQKAIDKAKLLNIWHKPKEVKLIATILSVKSRGEVSYE